MSESRWLQQLQQTYMSESVGQPTDLQEELIQEQEEYISILENIVTLVVEELNLDLDAIVEATKKKPAKAKPLSPAQLKALGMTRNVEQMAARGTGGGAKAVKARTSALRRLEAIAGTTQGRNLLNKIK